MSEDVVGDEYKVRLDIFEGPLDLLLYLIKKDEIDIYEISIERITKQYCEYIDTFKMLNIDLASEFVVMAANLMYIKSRTLLPKPEQPPDEDAEEDDPRWDLIRQLLEYKKFKDAANFLGEREYEQGELFAHIPEAPKFSSGPPPPPNVNIFDLIRAFQNVLKRFQEEELELGEIVDDLYTVSDKIDYLLERVIPGTRLSFASMFEKVTSRTEVIVTFLALLELIRLKQFCFEQQDPLGDIEVIRRETPLTVTPEVSE